MITARTITRLSSVPMSVKNAGMKVSMSPTRRPPTTAPAMESKPPRAAAAKPYSRMAPMKLKSSTPRYSAMIAPAMVPIPAASAQPSISIRWTGMPTRRLDSPFAATAR
jgi:hypothetical protein